MDAMIREYNLRKLHIENETRKNEVLLKRIKSRVPTGTTRVLTLTSKSDSPYEDTYTLRDDGILLVKWRGQMISKLFDEDMEEPDVEKHFFIKRGTQKRWNDAALGDWNTTPKYKYMGKIIKVELIVPRKAAHFENPYPIYTLEVQISGKTPVELTLEQKAVVSANKYKDKMEGFMKYGFYPEMDQISKGPVFCKI